MIINSQQQALAYDLNLLTALFPLALSLSLFSSQVPWTRLLVAFSLPSSWLMMVSSLVWWRSATAALTLASEPGLRTGPQVLKSWRWDYDVPKPLMVLPRPSHVCSFACMLTLSPGHSQLTMQHWNAGSGLTGTRLDARYIKAWVQG